MKQFEKTIYLLNTPTLFHILAFVVRLNQIQNIYFLNVKFYA